MDEPIKNLGMRNCWEFKGKGQNTSWRCGVEPSGWNGMFLIDHHTVEVECTMYFFDREYDVFHKERLPQ